MTPQEITDLAASASERVTDFFKKKYAEERKAIDDERARVQALCGEHTGHVYGPDPNPLSSIFGDRKRGCVYCGAQEPAAAAKDGV